MPDVGDSDGILGRLMRLLIEARRAAADADEKLVGLFLDMALHAMSQRERMSPNSPVPDDG
jgi:hypothetical protein